jgi:hypothetical protein
LNCVISVVGAARRYDGKVVVVLTVLFVFVAADVERRRVA